MCASYGECTYSLMLGARVCDCGWHVMNEDACHSVRTREQGARCDTANQLWAQVSAPTGTGEKLTPLPPAWRLEPGATSKPHQHQAHPCLRPGEPTPGSISGLSPPSSWWGATCILHLAPTTASTGKQGSRPAPLATFCVGINTGYVRCPQLNLATWPGARGHQLPSSL